MKKLLASVTCALVVASSLSVVADSSKLGLLGADVVSAATGEAPATTTTTTTSSGSKTTTTTKTSTGSKTSTSTASATKFTRVLKYGYKGSDVKLLQTVLNIDGYKLTVDGSFGPKTLTAVKDFQKKNGLEVDGSVGPATQAKLTPMIPAPPVFTRVLKKGSKGEDVKSLQTILNENGYKLTVDGSFGPATLAAVKDYQKKNGLKVDGSVGPATQAKLTEKPAATTPTTTTTTPTTTTPTTTTPTTTTPDTVSAASLTDNAAVFEKSVGVGGKWIVCTTKDLTFDHAIVVDGHFLNGKTDTTTGLKAIQHKIGLYSQDANKVVTARFTLTAPKITILSMNTSIEQGTVKGDIYVSAQNFKLKGATVQGNVFFTNKGAEATFTMDATSSITGMKTQLLLPETVDAYASASKVTNESAFETAISSTGKWIAATLNNLKFDHEIVVSGGVKKAATDAAEQRKLAIYAHDIKDSKLTTGRFILEAPKMTINSANANITKGMFKGNLYITAPNFKLVDAIVDGNIYFTTQEAKDTFTKDATSIITGVQALQTN